LPETPFDALTDLKIDWGLKFSLWNGRQEWDRLQQDYIFTKFEDIVVEDIQKNVDKYDKEASKCAINL